MNSESFIRTWGPLMAASLGIFALTLDGTMMNVAISDLVTDFQTDVSNVQTTIGLHSLVMASFYLTGGKLGDIYGKKKIFSIGIILFGIGTLMAALSPTMGLFTLGWSVIKSTGGMMMVPATLALIVANYEEARRALAFGIYAAMISVGLLIAPLLMGFLSTTLTWRLGFGLEPIITSSRYVCWSQSEKRRPWRVSDSIGWEQYFLV